MKFPRVLNRRSPCFPTLFRSDDKAIVRRIAALGGIFTPAMVLALAVLGFLPVVHAVETLAPSNGAITLNVNTGAPITPITFDVAGSTHPFASWELAAGSTFPTGLTFGVFGGSTAAGTRLIVAGTVNTARPTLEGTPTVPGTYILRLVAYELTNRGGLSTSTFTYTVNVASTTAAVPTILTQPQSQIVNGGATVTFTVVASGALTYQWRKNSVNIPGATTFSYTLNNVSTSDSGSYTVVIANNSPGSVTSAVALLTVTGNAPLIPAFTVQPQSVTVRAGTTAALTASASNTTSYLWRRNGAAIAGATTNTLILTSVNAQTAGSYTLDATGPDGAATSNPATITVTVAEAEDSKLSNLSVRTNLASSQTLTVGFVTNGNKSLLLRAVGPTLSPVFGINEFFSDPNITVFRPNGTVLTQNDNWSLTLSDTIASVGAFPLTPGSRDAALLQTINGPSTAKVAGLGQGIVLMEVYDADVDTVAARLINVSARNQVGTGTDVLVSGFVIIGPVAKTVLIRGIGPGLKDVFGLSGNLLDPQLEVFTQSNVRVAENDNWSTTLSPYFSSVGAYALTANSKDSALLVTLPPGIYTAQVSGVASSIGDGVVEVYVLP